MSMDLGVDLNPIGFADFAHLIRWDFFEWKLNQTQGRVVFNAILLKDLCEGA